MNHKIVLNLNITICLTVLVFIGFEIRDTAHLILPYQYYALITSLTIVIITTPLSFVMIDRFDNNKLKKKYYEVRK